MISLDEAFAAYARVLRALPTETIPVLEGLHRVLAEPVASATDLPRFDQSAMDGYAFRAADVATASDGTPVQLAIARQIAAGDPPSRATLADVTAARILTGAPVPPGADTVIPQERIRREGDALVFTSPYPSRKNIRYRGEELSRNSPVAAAGSRVSPGLLASLVNAGITELCVHRRPTIRLLVTGDEVRPAGSRLDPGQIPDSNGPLVRAVLASWGYPAPEIGYVADRGEAVRDALARAFDGADVVITTGGASAGDRDFLPIVAESLNVQRVFWQVAQKPGKPLYFGVRDVDGRRAALLALPGNPGAVLIGMTLHLRRALDLLEGVAEPQPVWAVGVLASAVERDAQRARLVRMRLDYDGGAARLTPLHLQDSHMLSNLATADVLVRIDAGETPLHAGDHLPWMPLPR
jgi:molybdopterin molybdotransferase